MFKLLKDKLKTWIKGTEKKAEKAQIVKAKKEKPKEKTKKAKKAKQELKLEHRKRTQAELEEERKLGGEVLEDIEKEKIEITTPESRFDNLTKSEEEIKEERPKKKGFFSKLKDKFSYRLSEEDFNSQFEELELALLENNVALEVVDKIKENLKQALVDKEIKKSEIESRIKETLKSTLGEIIKEPFDLIKKIKEKDGTFVILFFGINGSGKTTTIARLAYLLKKHNISCVLAAGDTFRAASIEQLQKHADNLKLELIKQHYGADPSAVAFDAIKHAKARNIKAVLIDTAGRMHTKENLMSEMAKIVKVTQPDLKIFVGESITGNDATEQARNFNETAGIDGIILTKADVDEKSGTLISVSYITGKPILYLGVGQEYEDLEPFKKEEVIKELEL